MARKLNADVTQIMELEEYDIFVREKIDLGDFDSLCETAWALKALANNRSFLARAANQKLQDCLDGKRPGYFTANSIIFLQRDFYTVRANIWGPAGARIRARSQLRGPALLLLQLPRSQFPLRDHGLFRAGL